MLSRAENYLTENMPGRSNPEWNIKNALQPLGFFRSSPPTASCWISPSSLSHIQLFSYLTSFLVAYCRVWLQKWCTLRVIRFGSRYQSFLIQEFHWITEPIWFEMIVGNVLCTEYSVRCTPYYVLGLTRWTSHHDEHYQVVSSNWSHSLQSAAALQSAVSSQRCSNQKPPSPMSGLFREPFRFGGILPNKNETGSWWDHQYRPIQSSLHRFSFTFLYWLRLLSFQF